MSYDVHLTGVLIVDMYFKSTMCRLQCSSNETCANTCVIQRMELNVFMHWISYSRCVIFSNCQFDNKSNMIKYQGIA